MPSRWRSGDPWGGCHCSGLCLSLFSRPDLLKVKKQLQGAEPYLFLGGRTRKQMSGKRLMQASQEVVALVAMEGGKIPPVSSSSNATICGAEHKQMWAAMSKQSKVAHTQEVCTAGEREGSDSKTHTLGEPEHRWWLQGKRSKCHAKKSLWSYNLNYLLDELEKKMVTT